MQCRGEYNMIHELTFLSQANMTYLFQNLHIIMHIIMQSARILPIHVKEGVKRGKSTSFFHFRKRQELGHEKSGKYHEYSN